MKNNPMSLKISNEQLEKLNELVNFFESDKGKIIRRGIYLIEKYNLVFKKFEEGTKTNVIRSNFSDEDMKIINKIINKYDIQIQELLRYGIEIQYEILEDLKEYEKKLLTGK